MGTTSTISQIQQSQYYNQYPHSFSEVSSVTEIAAAESSSSAELRDDRITNNPCEKIAPPFIDFLGVGAT